MDATVHFPHSGITTTRLGVGLATLMREPSAKAQQRLLEVAYEAGFRHFDVAPSYGLGAAERVLGRFIATRRNGITVGTKVGITLRRDLVQLQTLQRPVRALLRRFPALRGRATRAVGSAMHVRSNFSPPACTRSLENSLRALRSDAIDLLLLHDPEPSDLSDGRLFEWMSRQRDRGVVRNIGVATSPTLAANLIATSTDYDAVQVPSNVLAPASQQLGPSSTTPLRLTHSAVALPLTRISERLESDPEWTTRFSQCAGIDVRERDVVARLMLAWALQENSHGIVLLGASRPEHFREAVAGMGQFDATQLKRTEEFLRTSFE